MVLRVSQRGSEVLEDGRPELVRKRMNETLLYTPETPAEFSKIKSDLTMSTEWDSEHVVQYFRSTCCTVRYSINLSIWDLNDTVTRAIHLPSLPRRSMSTPNN